MKRKLLIIVFILMVFMSVSHGEQPPRKRVLLISSYSPSFETFYKQIEGVKAGFNGMDVILDVEFMDSKRLNTSVNERNFLESLTYKLNHLPTYDGILVADDNALKFVILNRDRLFSDLPVVFFGINDLDRATMADSIPGVTGVVEAISLEETIDLALKLIPSAKAVVALVDNTPSGQGDLELFYELDRQFPEIEFNDLNLSEISVNDYEEQLSGFNDETILILLSAYEMQDGMRIDFDESVKWIIGKVSIPVFHPYEHGIGDGLIGGKVISHFEQGKHAAEHLKQVFEGKSIEEMALVNESPNRYLLDYEVIEKFNIQYRNVVEIENMINYQPAFVLRHMNAILNTILTLIILTLLYQRLHKYYLGTQVTRQQLETTRMELAQEQKHSEEIEQDYLKILQRFQTAIMESPLPICIHTSEGTILEVSHVWKEEIEKVNTNHKLSSILTELIRKENEDLGTSKSQKIEIEDKGLKTYEAITKCIDSDADTIYMTILFDNTLNVEIRKELEKAQFLAEESNLAKSRFLSYVSHEIRTPLNGIIGMLQLLNKSNFDDEQLEDVEIVLASCNHLTLLLSDILEYTRVYSGTVKIKRKPTVISELIANLQEFHAPSYRNKGMMLYMDIDSSVPECVMIDELRVKQVLNNFLTNAFKYTEEGFVKLRVFTHKDNDVEMLCFSVSDSGIGINDEDLSRIFDRFEQIRDRHVDTMLGVGLGLAIVKELAELMGGEVEVQSQIGVGSTFLFKLKAEKIENEKDSDSLNQNVISYNPLSENHRVLIVSSDFTLVKRIKAMFKNEDAVVRRAYSLDIASQMLEVEAFDVIILDMDIYSYEDQLNGNIGEYLRLALQTSIIGLVSSSEIIEEIAIPCNCCVVKPVDKKDLFNAINRLDERGHFLEAQAEMPEQVLKRSKHIDAVCKLTGFDESVASALIMNLIQEGYNVLKNVEAGHDALKLDKALKGLIDRSDMIGLRDVSEELCGILKKLESDENENIIKVLKNFIASLESTCM